MTATLRPSWRLLRDLAAALVAVCAAPLMHTNIAAAQSTRAGAPNARNARDARLTRDTLTERNDQQIEFGSISGVAFDSLLMKPLAGVTIELVGSGRTTQSDARGKFRFDNVATGAHQVSLNESSLDTLGFGTLGANVTVAARARADVNITSPSLRTLWNRSCMAANTIGADSGIVWGTIREAETQATQSEAAATFNWYDLRGGKVPGLLIREVREQAATNPGGVYFACGLPSDVAIASGAITKDAASGRIDYALGARRLHRLDLTVSREMVINDSAVADSGAKRLSLDSLAETAPHGTAIVRGRVLNDRNQPLANALVAIMNVDTLVRTDSSGNFRLGGLPAGTQALSVRRVGTSPVSNVVQLRPGQTSDVDVIMSSVNTLTTVNVRAEKTMSRERLDFEQRKKSAFVRVREGEIFEKRADMYSVLDNMPELIMRRDGFGLDITIRRFGRQGCTPEAYLDGFLVDVQTASSLPVELYRAVEVYKNGYTLPAEFTTQKGTLCGAMLFWTRRIKW